MERFGCEKAAGRRFYVDAAELVLVAWIIGNESSVAKKVSGTDMRHLIHGLGSAAAMRVVLVVSFVCLWSRPAAGMSGGPYTLDWTDMPGGGSTITGGTFSLSGSVGQPDAGVLRGGTFTLKGGFGPHLSPIQGDINADGFVNVGDLQLLVAGWGSSRGVAGFKESPDLNDDGFVNVGDLQLLVAHWGQSGSPY